MNILAHQGLFRRSGAAVAVAISALLCVSSFGFADAPDPAPAAAAVRVGPTFLVGGVQVARVSVNGRWQWPTHHSDCNTNRTGAGYAVDWGDPNQGGNHVTTLSSVGSIDVGAASANPYNPADNEVRPTRAEASGSLFNDPDNNTATGSWNGGCGTFTDMPRGVWGAVDLATGNPVTCTSRTAPSPTCMGGSHVYTVAALEAGITLCAIMYDVHGGDSNAGGHPNGSKEITGGGSGHNGDNGAEKNGSTPLGNTCSPIDIPKPDHDLSILKTGPGSATVGGNVTFTLLARNLGPGDATNAVITDAIPANYSYVSNDSGCSVASGTITCSLGDLANGASRTLHVTLRLNSAVSDGTADCDTGNHENPNTARISGDGLDTDGSNDQSTACVPVRNPDHDLSILKTGPASTSVGSNVNFTLTARNLGPGSVSGIKVTDPIPANYSYVSNDGGCTVSAGTLNCNIGTLAEGASRTIHLVLKLNSSITVQTAECDNGHQNPNTAYIAGDGNDTDSTNDQSTACIPVRGDHDLEIVKTAASSTSVGSNVTFTLRARNLGPGDATNAVVTDPIPSNYSYISNDAGCSVQAGSLICDLGAMASGDTRTIHLVLKLNSSITVSTADCGSTGNHQNPNTAYISSDPVDTNSANDQDTACVSTGSPNPDVKIVKTASPSNTTLGSNVTFTLTATNLGPGSATNVTVTDAIPSNYSYVSNDGGCSVSGGTVTCNVGTLSEGASRAIHLVLKLNSNVTNSSTSCSSNPNTGRVSSSPADSNSGNNSSTACVTINQPKGFVKVCVDTLGYARGGTFNFSATWNRSASITLPNGTNRGCAFIGGSYPVGQNVFVQEAVPSTMIVTGISANPSGQLVSKNVAGANATVKVYSTVVNGQTVNVVTLTFFNSLK